MVSVFHTFTAVLLLWCQLQTDYLLRDVPCCRSSHPCGSQLDHSTSLSPLFYIKSKSLSFAPQHSSLFSTLKLLGKPAIFSHLCSANDGYFLLILQAPLHSLSYYALRTGKPCKAVLILFFSPSLKTTSVVMPINHSHKALIKQVIICDFFSAHLCSLCYYLIFLTQLCLVCLLYLPLVSCLTHIMCALHKKNQLRFTKHLGSTF